MKLRNNWFLRLLGLLFISYLSVFICLMSFYTKEELGLNPSVKEVLSRMKSPGVKQDILFVTDFNAPRIEENIEMLDIDSIFDGVDKITYDGLQNWKYIELNDELYVSNFLASRKIGNVGSENESFSNKYWRLFKKDGTGKEGRIKYYNSEEEALKDMVTFNVTVWDIKGSGEWYKKTISLTSHRELKNTFVQICNDLLKLPEELRVPIKTMYCYNYRSGSSTHSCGAAVDINENENAEMTSSGVITAGYYWKPYEDVYSIPEDSMLVKIFKKYGFGWGGYWTGKKDYMHFSYFDR